MMDTAIALQHAGQINSAIGLYEKILERDQNQYIAEHNLGILLLDKGEIKQALKHIRESLIVAHADYDTSDTYRIVGKKLFELKYWEAAVSWLEKANLFDPLDQSVSWMLQRIQPRSYLQSEIYDPHADQVLKRYSPREGESYIYAIDIVGNCNLKCPTCPVANSSKAGRPRGYMSLELFTGILEKIKRESICLKPEIFLYSWGEPLLHQRLPEMIRKIRDFGFTSHLSSNLNIKTNLDEVIMAAPDTLKISISGFTEATYSKTHQRGNIDLVKKNMRRLHELVARNRIPTRIWVGHHIYKSTEPEIPEMKAYCTELGIEYFSIPAFYQPLERLVALIEKTEKPVPVMDDLLEHPLDYLGRLKAVKQPELDCELRFNQTAINCDGSVALCCSSYDPENFLKVNFLDVSHAEIAEKKYRHSFCDTCYMHGLQYSPAKPPR